ncbi:alpha/beta fold hydrolase [Sorangium sp. So ce448]|uniref:thioesterase II family protein n=1 Tax=Sorangium sp. So ce448 TaxID=3133314 RepID=UPI003F5E749B
MTSHTSVWLPSYQRAAAPRARLFCFPYAGGAARIYSRWSSGLPSDIEVYGVELPGHGTRWHPRVLVTQVEPLVEALAPELTPLLDVPYFLFGHSMGALLAFLCARELRRRGSPLPARLFVSGRIAPHIRYRDSSVSAMTDADLAHMLRVRGGTAPQILAEPELMAALIPNIRADFSLLESYIHADEAPLECAITAFAGTHDDQATEADLGEWRAHTAGSFGVELVEGGHFFVDNEREKVVNRVRQMIECSLQPVNRTAMPAHGVH